MNCEQLRKLLDAYMDGELSDAQLREMEAHAATCADCGRELEAAKLAREALRALPEEVAVPLNVQASWRKAVREEAKRASNADERTVEYVRSERGRKRRWLRAAYAVAAALVLVLGATAVLGRMPGRETVEPMTLAAPEGAVLVERSAREAGAMPTGAVVARDGEADMIEQAPGEESFAAWKKYIAEDAAAAGETVEALVEEYSGSFAAEKSWEDAEAQAGGASATYRIELPSEYLDDFLAAVSHVGEEQDSERMEAAGDTAMVYIRIEEPYSE